MATLFLTIRSGDDDPEGSYPMFATADPEIIALVVRGLARKLGGDSSLSNLKLRKNKGSTTPKINP